MEYVCFSVSKHAMACRVLEDSDVIREADDTTAWSVYVERRGQLRETPELNESTAGVDASVEMPKLHNIKLLYNSLISFIPGAHYRRSV